VVGQGRRRAHTLRQTYLLEHVDGGGMVFGREA